MVISSEIFLPINLKVEKKMIMVHVEVVLIFFVLLTAIISDYKIDARKCISYLTIEHKGPVPISIRNKLEIKFTVVMIAYLYALGINFAKPT